MTDLKQILQDFCALVALSLFAFSFMLIVGVI